MLNAWREAPFYSERERAALAWAEALTLLSETHAPDDAHEKARKQFSEKEIVDLTLAIVAINGANRLAVAFRAPAGRTRRENAVKQRWEPARRTSALPGLDEIEWCRLVLSAVRPKPPRQSRRIRRREALR